MNISRTLQTSDAVSHQPVCVQIRYTVTQSDHTGLYSKVARALSITATDLIIISNLDGFDASAVAAAVLICRLLFGQAGSAAFNRTTDLPA